MPDQRHPDRGSGLRSGSGWRDFRPAILLLIIGVLGLAAATLAPSGRNGQYAVVVPPWYSAAQALSVIRDADGRIAEGSVADHVLIAHSDKPGFVRDLYRAGAWLVFDPVRQRGCAGSRSSVRKEQA